ncbi:MAG: hypothetical protein K9M36_01150 [Candidatus Pacebacteria bacterium]|nr:hypothetical protein [Candidatus Paceibacterota bacterium]
MENQSLPSGTENKVLFVNQFDPLTKSDSAMLRILQHCSKQEGFHLIIVVPNEPMGTYLYKHELRIAMVEDFLAEAGYENPLISVEGYSKNFFSPSEIASRFGARDCVYGVIPAYSWGYLKKRLQIFFSKFLFPEVQNFLVKGERRSRVTLDAVQRAIVEHDYDRVKKMVPASIFGIIRTREYQILGI